MPKLKDLLGIFRYKEDHEYSFDLKEKEYEQTDTNDADNIDFTRKNSLPNNNVIYNVVSVNLEQMKKIYGVPDNSDVSIREFILHADGKQYDAFLIFIDGMVNSEFVNNFVLKPLMLNKDEGVKPRVVNTVIANNITVKKTKRFNLQDHILKALIPQNSIKNKDTFGSVIEDINSGNCLLFVDTLTTVFSIDAKGFEKRSVSPAQNEAIIRGSQEAFVEALRTNTSMIRRAITNENLVVEGATVGSESKTKCAILYMKNIANDDLIAEVKKRVNNIDVDYITSSGQLEQLIEDKNISNIPQILSTERPDKTTLHLLEGRVAIIVNGSPYALIMPVTLSDFILSTEDTNVKFQYANLTRVMRIIGLFISLLLPGLYVAISNYHQELLPTELLFAIAASREVVPFPVIFEILIMEIAFELIREAGLRIPGAVGSTMGIIGGLVLGQAAVTANIISPILIIIVAITGIASYAVPDYSLSFSIRLLRFVYTILGYLMGFLGIGLGIFINILVLANLKSFGVPFLTPYLPVTNVNTGLEGYVAPIWRREKRADYLNTKKETSQAHVSRRWKQ